MPQGTDAIQLRRCLAFLEARMQFKMWAMHIPGARNQVADAISRDNLLGFRVLRPQAQEQESPVPQELLDTLLLLELNWTCRNWMELWTTSMVRH